MSRTTEVTTVRIAEPLYGDALEFLYREAELLNDNRFEEWFTLLADDIAYVAPVRKTVNEGDGDGFSAESGWFDDDRRSLELRMKHLQSAGNWSEQPLSRTRRFVGNVSVDRIGDELMVRSSVLLVRSRWDDRTVEFLSAKRNDVLVWVDGDLKLRRREILFDQTNLNMPNLAVFL
jgi:ethylbenzene dioxygenase beta subunit